MRCGVLIEPPDGHEKERPCMVCEGKDYFLSVVMERK